MEDDERVGLLHSPKPKTTGVLAPDRRQRGEERPLSHQMASNDEREEEPLLLVLT
jgi:hypothetical protein